MPLMATKFVTPKEGQIAVMQAAKMEYEEARSNEWRIEHMTLEDVPYGTRVLFEDLGYFPMLMGPGTNGETLWMSPSLFELCQMYIDAVHVYGDVLVGGLGLGIVVRMMAERDEVMSVTVVERSADVISLIEPYLPSGKVAVVCSDLETYCRDISASGQKPFDTAAIDIFENVMDSYFASEAMDALVTPVLRDNNGLRLWGSAVFRKVASTAARYEPRELTIDDDLEMGGYCFACGAPLVVKGELACGDCSFFMRAKRKDILEVAVRMDFLTDK